MRLIPFILVIVLGILFIIPFVILWVCICNPKCCCRKKSRITKPLNCLIILMALSGCCIILVSVVIAYINSSKKGLNGTVCTLTMLTNDITLGAGLLGKIEFTKPYWYGLEEVEELVDDTSEMLGDIQNVCGAFTTHLNTLPTPSGIQYYTNSLTKFPENILNKYTPVGTTKISPSSTTSPSNPSTGSSTYSITPLYISNLGPPNDESTYLGKVLTEFQNNYADVIMNVVVNMTIQCAVLSNTTVSGNFERNLDSINAITSELKSSMSSLTGDIVDLLDKYKGLIINYLFNSFLAFNIIIMIFIVIEGGLMIFYSNRNYNMIRLNLICIWAIIGILLIFLFIFAAIFGIIATVVSDVGDIVDFLFSNENLSAGDEGRIITGGQVKNLKTCLRGDGDLLSAFVEDENIKKFTNALNILFNMYAPIYKANALLESEDKNNLKELESLENLHEYLEKVKEDVTLATNKATHGSNDLQTILDELNKYSMGTYQSPPCPIKDYYVILASKCPSDINYSCKSIITSPRSTSPTDYGTCTVNSPQYPYGNLDAAFTNFEEFFYSINSNSGGLITQLQNAFTNLTLSSSSKFEYNEYIIKLQETMKKIVDVIDVPYKIYSPYVNSDALKNGEIVDIFSWLNCTIIGRDINATVNTIKKQLRGDLRVIFFVSLSDNCIIIAIMIVTTFLLNWYKFDPLENNPVGEMEFGKKKKEYDGENVSDISDSNISSEDISEKNKNGNESVRTDDVEDKKSKIKLLKRNEDEYSQKSQFGDNNGNNNNLENPQTINIQKNEDNKNNESKKYNKNKDDSSDSGESFRYNTIKKIAKNGDKENEIDNPINNIDKNKKSINNPFN